MARRAVVGEVAHLTVIAGAMLLDWRFGLVAFAFPTFAVRFLMMVGNWGQHAFVNPARKNDGLANAITCINSGYNQRCFNDGYHIGHHLKANRHWTEMPRRLPRQPRRATRAKARSSSRGSTSSSSRCSSGRGAGACSRSASSASTASRGATTRSSRCSRRACSRSARGRRARRGVLTNSRARERRLPAGWKPALPRGVNWARAEPGRSRRSRPNRSWWRCTTAIRPRRGQAQAGGPHPAPRRR